MIGAKCLKTGHVTLTTPIYPEALYAILPSYLEQYQNVLNSKLS